VRQYIGTASQYVSIAPSGASTLSAPAGVSP
jgi:hypothetical protein